MVNKDSQICHVEKLIAIRMKYVNARRRMGLTKSLYNTVELSEVQDQHILSS